MAHPINLRLARNIQAARKRRGFTQEQLAELVKTSYKYIQRIEGKQPPDLRISSLEKIAKVHKIKPAKLLNFFLHKIPAT